MGAVLPIALRAQGAGELPRTHTPQPTHAEMSTADLMTRLYILADDSMQGRQAGQPGNARATAYIAREFQRIGLTPGGEGGGYFQTVPIVTKGLRAGSSLSAGGT